MKSFRETFYDLMRAQKANNGNWTKSFTWRQVIDLYDSAAQVVGLSEMPGCVAHGFCPGCVQDENDRQFQEFKDGIDRAMAKAEQAMEALDESRRTETGDNRSSDPGDPRTS